ncbi:hypothetical protein XA68_17252 [Ophiocordyceps unilateralis]|uniref:Uncharacterized protein n=1 Tax=Ophiocordyceps unilateralis TaxID=268505 RepID=A0A2A9PRY8_OPHUN|nr:hypothetical protein XA68_17252 [Ophiocordyceps unilateralis]
MALTLRVSRFRPTRTGHGYEIHGVYDDMPQCVGYMPIGSASELARQLKLRPLTDDFWMPIPSRRAISDLLVLRDPPQLNLTAGQESDRRPTQHVIGGLLYASRLRTCLIEELLAMADAAPRLHAGTLGRRVWRMRCRRAVEVLRWEVRVLEGWAGLGWEVGG